MNTGTDMRLAGGTAPVFRSDSMRRLMATVERLAAHDSAVLVVGETGVGKELIAQAIHQQSHRREKPFVDVNCAAFPEHLVESELFGYEKGAFSGADSTKPGLFEMAHQGTLFLDEIGELDLKVQAKLLRVLDGAPYYRLGGSRKVDANVRVVAATNRKLEEEVKAGRFRDDLYHRIAQSLLSVPALRERPDDIVLLAEHFLQKQHPSMEFSPEAADALQRYAWQGNVRELRNVVMNVAMAAKPGTKVIHARELPVSIFHPPDATAQSVFKGDLRDMERHMILQALEMNSGSQERTAAQLGISTRTLRRKLEKYRKDAEGALESGTSAGRTTGQLQRYFRVDIELQVNVRQGERELHATTSNISLGGMAVRGADCVESTAPMEISFLLPGQDSPIETKATLAWTGPGGHAGLSFVDMHPVLQRQLHDWMIEKSQHQAPSKPR